MKSLKIILFSTVLIFAGCTTMPDTEWAKNESNSNTEIIHELDSIINNEFNKFNPSANPDNITLSEIPDSVNKFEYTQKIIENQNKRAVSFSK